MSSVQTKTTSANTYGFSICTSGLREYWINRGDTNVKEDTGTDWKEEQGQAQSFVSGLVVF